MAVRSLHFAFPHNPGIRPVLACGRKAVTRDPHCTNDWSLVTCKRCLAAKADMDARKARREAAALDRDGYVCPTCGRYE